MQDYLNTEFSKSFGGRDSSGNRMKGAKRINMTLRDSLNVLPDMKYFRNLPACLSVDNNSLPMNIYLILMIHTRSIVSISRQINYLYYSKEFRLSTFIYLKIGSSK
jgi:hypothetical protein